MKKVKGLGYILLQTNMKLHQGPYEEYWSFKGVSMKLNTSLGVVNTCKQSLRALYENTRQMLYISNNIIGVPKAVITKAARALTTFLVLGFDRGTLG